MVVLNEIQYIVNSYIRMAMKIIHRSEKYSHAFRAHSNDDATVGDGATKVINK